MATSKLAFSLLFICCFCLKFVASTTNITTHEFLLDSETITSSNSRFKMGFFSPTNSTNRYVGIWYNIKDSDTKEVVWVANRNNPVNGSFGVLKISKNGNLQLLGGQGKILWSSSNASIHKRINHISLVAKLQDTGNLLLMSNASGKIIWQSFHHLTDSLLPQMSITVNLSITNRALKNQDEYPVLQSSKSASDPANGRFTMSMIRHPITEIVIRRDDEIFWRSGPWNGHSFIGVPYLLLAENLKIVYNDEESRLNMSYSASNESMLQYIALNHNGNLVLKKWDDGSRKWEIMWKSIESECDVFGKCGRFGSCNPKGSPICRCLHGFEPTNKDEWKEGNWSSGCIRKRQLMCGVTGPKEDMFLKLKHMKVGPNFTWFKGNDEDACRIKCLETCSCVAYAHSKGIGCMIWQDLIDMQAFPTDGADLFIRLSHSEFDDNSYSKTVIAVKATIVATLFVVFLYYLSTWIFPGHVQKPTKKETQSIEDGVDQPECKVFNFKELQAATNNFADINKLGEGGFGPVYKGKLEDGQEIAVKRLSRVSGQGLREFMNEVRVISELQHRNLVRLLGCCAERDEKLLIYELMPNKSLDALLFDSHHTKQLDWKKRFNIINGICRGLLYLHRDSRLKIIHRDLKASNILLDEQLNPKISDFGMARIFAATQDQDNTIRVVGTYGYMSPEYAMEGRFSEKSDVFSLGVLLLEIISGRKSSSFLNYEPFGLISYAWKLWNENDMFKLIDPSILEPWCKGEIMKCIRLGLLCLQEYPEDRPTVSDLISMLDNVNEIIALPLPTQPSFFQRKAISFNEILHDLPSTNEHDDVNHASLTTFSGG